MSRHGFNTHSGNVANKQWCAAGLASDDDLLNVGDTGNERLTSQKPLLVVMNDITSARRGIIGLDGFKYLIKGQRVGAEQLRIGPDLKGFVVASVRIDFRHARDFS